MRNLIERHLFHSLADTKKHWSKPRSNDQGHIRTSELVAKGKDLHFRAFSFLGRDGWAQHSVTGRFHLPWHVANTTQAREPRSFLEEPERFLPQGYIEFVDSTRLGHQVRQCDTQKSATGFRILQVKADTTNTLQVMLNFTGHPHNSSNFCCRKNEKTESNSLIVSFTLLLSAWQELPWFQTGLFIFHYASLAIHSKT